MSPDTEPVADWRRQLALFVARPLTGAQALLAWVVATLLYLAVTSFLGGPSVPDLVESLNSTIALAHGQWACVYPVHGPLYVVEPTAQSVYLAPLYTMVAGGLAFLLRIGHLVPFPSPTQLGPGCVDGVARIHHWLVASGAQPSYQRLAYWVWLPLSWGVVAAVRAFGRGRRGAEVIALLAVALAPPVFLCVGYDFHPEYLAAIGLSLWAAAFAVRHHWGRAGLAIALAVLAQQFAILVAVALVVVAPRVKRVRFVTYATFAVAAIVVPLAAVTSTRAFTVALLGSSRVTPRAPAFHSSGGTWLWELHLTGVPLFLASRVAPLLATAILAAWVRHRTGDRVDHPEVVGPIVALALASRLLFEQNLFGYYFTALVVALLVLEVVGGRLRRPAGLWLATVALAFNPVPSTFASRFAPWGAHGAQALVVVALLGGIAVVIADLRARRLDWLLVGWILFVVVVFHRVLLGDLYVRLTLAGWLWQALLVPTGIALVLGPLLAGIAEVVRPPSVREHRRTLGTNGPPRDAGGLGSIDTSH